MAIQTWPTRQLSVASLHLDAKNPRLGRETAARAPHEIIKYLFEHDKAMDVAESIATCGYFPNEPLLAIQENGRLVVIEGNRRLAALKTLLEPGLLEGSKQRKLERLARHIIDPNLIKRVPVTIAPNRRATDRQISARHIATPVLAWRQENRASFILEKLAEGYTNDELRDDLGFDLSDIQNARQTRAIAEMARSLKIPEELRAKLENPDTKVFTTLERVFNSSVGRQYLMVEPDPDHGLRGTTTKEEFVRGFTKLVSDVVLGRQTSRSLNTNDDIQRYFKKWKPEDVPVRKRGSFIPSDIIRGKSVASPTAASGAITKPKQSKKESLAVLPRDFKVRCDNHRLIDIRDELVRLKRKDFPNAGAVMLRVFFELASVDYLERTGELAKLIQRLKDKKAEVPHGVPTMRQFVPELVGIARKSLKPVDATRVEKALRYDAAAPFTISDFHGFVHSTDLPSERDILQFWLRLEALFRLMLETEPKEANTTKK